MELAPRRDLLLVGPMARGTDEWEHREAQRQIAGCKCLSYGQLPREEATVILEVRKLTAWRLARRAVVKLRGPMRPEETRDGEEDDDSGEAQGRA